MSTTMTRSSFSNAAFAQLVRRLRHTNARYNRIAHQLRCRIHRTHHAKRRACWAGLRIDTSKARACPDKYVSVHPPPVLDRSLDSPTAWADPPGHTVVNANVHATTQHAHARVPTFEQGDAYMQGMPQRYAPTVVVRKRRRDGRQRVVLRLPPLKLQLDVDYTSGAGASPFQGPVPGAPRLSPRQLPDDEYGVEEMMLESSSSWSYADESSLLLTPFDVRVYSGLCITIPPRNLKRKLHDLETDEYVPLSQEPKRFLKARWDESQRK